MPHPQYKPGTDSHCQWVADTLIAYLEQGGHPSRDAFTESQRRSKATGAWVTRADVDRAGGWADVLYLASEGPRCLPNTSASKTPTVDVSGLDWDEVPDTSPGVPFEIQAPPEEIDLPDLIDRRKRQYERKRAHEDGRRLIPVAVNDPGPIGILFFGDPHVDDDGTDLAELERQSLLVRNTPGLFGANLGDTTNNWVGRLARLYGEQGTTAQEAWALAEWFIRLVGDKWLFLVGGNHDAWSGSGDPLNWIASQADALYQSSEVRLALTFPNGREVRVNARHDFAGHSQWNPAHGPMKAAQFGFRDHLLICGHKHVSGYGIVKDPAQGTISHCLQVASFKIFDRFARERGFRDQHVSPSVLVVIDPEADEVGLIDVYHDVYRGAAVLSMLRQRRAA